MAKRDTMLNALKKELGADYRICTIDLERCLYRDFGNGFNVEISGVYTAYTNKLATLYLWFGEGYSAIIVRIAHDVRRDEIGLVCDGLFEYSKQLIADGYNDRTSLFHMKYPELSNNQNSKGGN